MTDGPYAEAKEFLASFGVIDVESHDRAVEVAAAMSQVFRRVELRPLEGDGVEARRHDEMPVTTSVEVLLRELATQALGALVRRDGHFETAEDAVQEAMLAASVQWPRDGTPKNPRAWLVRVASRKLTDMLRAEQSRHRREDAELARTLPTDLWSPAADSRPAGEQDDSLRLLFLCCHPSLTTSSQVALTLRAVGGLTTAEIARAFLVPESTMAQRVSRAKQRLAEEGGRFRTPPPPEYPKRLRAVLHVLYLIFDEGYTSTSGARLHRVELTAEAVRLTRTMRRVLPDDGEVSGLLALMLLTDARRPARTTPEGDLVPLGDQDRGLWDKGLVADSVDLAGVSYLPCPGVLPSEQQRRPPHAR